jgi:hypothetical protein
MTERLDVKEGQEAEEVRKNFDNQMGVKMWRIPGQPEKADSGAPVEPGTPSWWHGEEDASQSFLMSMGVIIPDDH